MPKRERERIGPFVVTGADNRSPEGIFCAQCRKLISRYNQATDTHDPTCEELVRQGAVPVPNFGFAARNVGVIMRWSSE